MLIPMPLLFKVQLPLRRKLILGFLFGSGTFVIVITILRTYYALHDLKTLPIATAWACRETFVANIVVSAPAIKPLFKGAAWLGSSNRSIRQKTGGSLNMYTTASQAKSGISSRNYDGDRAKAYEMEKWGLAGGKGRRPGSAVGSEERIIIDDAMMGKESYMPVHITTEYSVSHEEATTESKEPPLSPATPRCLSK